MSKEIIDLTDLSMDNIKKIIKRKGIAILSGGIRPPENSSFTESIINEVKISLPDEEWPFFNGQPMYPMFQLNLQEAPFIPKNLSHISIITLFALDDDGFEFGKNNGEGWLIRSYSSLDNLIEIPSEIKPNFPELNKRNSKKFPVQWKVIEDCPKHEDLSDFFIVPKNISDIYYDDIFEENYGGSKLGGWPSLIQSELSFHGENILYSFQVDSDLRTTCWPFSHAIAYFGQDIKNQNCWKIELQFD